MCRLCEERSDEAIFKEPLINSAIPVIASVAKQSPAAKSDC